MDDLETRLERAFVAYRISNDEQRKLRTYLDLLHLKDQATYEHSIRVGLLCSAIGEYLHLDAKALFYAGIAHDTGKALTDPETLRKTQGFGEKDYQEIKLHPEHGYRIVLGLNDFTADVIARHHIYQQQPYPEHLPEYSHPYSNATKATIDFYAMIVSLADFYDSASTRVNEKFGEKRALTNTEVKNLLLEHIPHFRKLIDQLYRNGIFEDEPVTHTQAQDELIRQANTIPTYRTAQEVRRHVQIALALEPLAEKPPCTTRSTDCSRHLKLEYFVTAGINVGDAFGQLAQRLMDSETQPVIYDMAEQAQLDSVRNREGGRVNQGMIEMLTPIIAAQIMYDRDRSHDVPYILQKAVEVMANTTDVDVRHLLGLKVMAYDLCGYLDREVVSHDAKTVAEFYVQELAESDREVSRLHNAELINGFPTVKRMYDMLASEPERNLSERLRDAYLAVRAEAHNNLESGGLTADVCGAALYLLFSHHPQDVIVR